jgi:predicted nucleic acid-binding protein
MTAYDACYVVLAEKLGLRLLTADKKLSQQVSAVTWLGNL